jgi:TPR repeat protein
MKKFLRLRFLIILSCVLLQACTSAMQARRLDDGKASFKEGNFSEAFQKLMPLAAEGNAHAEYAVGYMYYYGYGITRDSQSGIFWMQKSAAQHYQPAEKAMSLIQTNSGKTTGY